MKRLEDCLSEIVHDDIYRIDRTTPRALCQTWCGRQVIAGKIFCSPCRSSWGQEKQRGRIISNFVAEERMRNLERHGIELRRHVAVWEGWE